MGLDIELEKAEYKALNKDIGNRLRSEMRVLGTNAAEVGRRVCEDLGVNNNSAMGDIQRIGRGALKAGPNWDSRAQTRDLGKLSIILGALNIDSEDYMIMRIKEVYQEFTYPCEGYNPWAFNSSIPPPSLDTTGTDQY
jgi:hypothetical protein